MLQLIIICALFAYGIFTLHRPGFPLYKLTLLWKTFPKVLHEPLFSCGICVASIWGGSCYLYLVWVDLHVKEENYSLYWLPIALICTVGVLAFIDRAVKALEKHYGYSPPSTKKGEAKWSYLVPYAELRRMIVNQFVVDNFNRGHHVIEIGGHNKKWEGNELYHYYDHLNKLDEFKILDLVCGYKNEGKTYSVIIMGLYFEGNLRYLKKLVECSQVTLIEYSDDGISREQVDFITKNIKTKLLIPEYKINPCETPPGQCGKAESRKVIILQP